MIDAKQAGAPPRPSLAVKRRLLPLLSWGPLACPSPPPDAHCEPSAQALQSPSFSPLAEKQFLAFFFKQLRLNRSGRYEDSFPYLSPCGREHNYVRCDDRPVVFTQLLQGASGEQLSYCGGGDRLTVPFQPHRLVMLPENGRVYHPGPEKAGGVGLVKSALAFELSPCFEYEQGPSRPPTHFRWQDKRHPLTHELLRLIRAEAEEGGA